MAGCPLYIILEFARLYIDKIVDMVYITLVSSMLCKTSVYNFYLHALGIRVLPLFELKPTSHNLIMLNASSFDSREVLLISLLILL